MKKIAGMLLLSTLATLAQAADSQSALTLDKVMFQLSAREWVSTQTALLTVSVNATLGNADLVKAREDIMANLKKIAEGSWQITQFDRSQDSSGLEKLYVAAQSRVPQASLTNIYQNAKAVSKPGASYEVNGVEFKPGLEEFQQAKSNLRNTLYQKVNDEIARLNKIYTNQSYSLNNIVFFEGDVAVPMQKEFQTNRMALAAAAPAAAITVSNELVLGALVELASNRVEGAGLANK